ncbi:MAG: LamG domain-containing protein [Candidatus Aenigmarchaeota archaeon]|nr:LamG domain-containing protein [Candidatus Aenigmarchaeota archaeon]
MKDYSKGITPVIAIVLLLMITIAIVGFSFTFLSGMFQTTTETTGKQIAHQLGAMSSCMQLDGVSFDKVYVRNCGSGSLYNFSIYVDGESIAVTNNPIVGESKAGELQLAKGVSGDAIKVTSPSAQVQLSLKHCTIDRLLPVSLVGYWMLDNDSARDYSGFGNNGVYYGGINCSAAGKFGQACAFDGINDYIQIPYSSSLNTTGKNMTVSAWIKVLGDTNGTVHDEIIVGRCRYNDCPSYDYSTGSWNIAFSFNNKYVAFQGYLADGTTTFISQSATNSINLNTWYHVTAVFDSSYTRLYLDGIQVDSDSHSSQGIRDSGALTRIGKLKDNAGVVFNGSIDDVAIWNKALSIDEIRKAYTKNC